MVIFILNFKYDLKIHKNYAIKPVSAISAIFGTFARTHPITLKLYQNLEGVILNKYHEKIGNIYGHLAKITIWNLKNQHNRK